MGYRNTPAFMSEGKAWSGGDTVWPPRPSLVIRHANRETVTNLPGADLGFVESIGPLIQSLTAVGSTLFQLRQSQLDSKQARNKEAVANAAAAKAAADAKIAADQAAQAIKQAEVQQVTAATAAGGSNKMVMYAVGAGVAALGVYLLLRKKK